MEPSNGESAEKITAEDVLRRYNDETLPDFPEKLVHANQVGLLGNRPLHIAALRGNVADARALIDGGADVNGVGDLGSTPLHEAVEQGHPAVIEILVAHGADSQRKNELGYTPLEIAQQNRKMGIIELLTKQKFNGNAAK